MKIIGYITTTVCVIVYTSILNGWALTKLWIWFVVSIFNLPSLTIPHAIGIALIVTYLTSKMDEGKKDKDEYWETLAKGFIYGTLKPVTVLLFGFIVKSFIH